MEISVRDLQDDMIKPSENGGLTSVVDSATHEVLISDTTLSSFIPPQVQKMMLNRVPGTQSHVNSLKTIRAKPQSMTEKCHTVRRFKHFRQLIM